MDLSQSIAPKVEDGLFGELESHQEKIFTVYILYKSVALVKENTMVYLLVHRFWIDKKLYNICTKADLIQSVDPYMIRYFN